MRYFIIALTASFFVCTNAVAQTVVFQNANILTGGSQSEMGNSSIVMTDGKIVSVGETGQTPRDAMIVDLQGATVTPGLVVASTVLGAVEVSSRANANDSSGATNVLSAGVDVQYAVNPRSSLLPVARGGGVTRAFVTPSNASNGPGQLRFGGQPAIIHTGEGADIVVNSNLGVTLNLNDSELGRGALYAQLKAVLADVRLYAKRPASFRDGELKARDWARADLVALTPIVTGKKPLVVSVDRASDISTILKISSAEKIKLILMGAAEGWMVADEIAAANAPVILDPSDNLPRNFNKLGATLENAARLSNAGVKIAIIGPRAGHDARLVRYYAGVAVSHGLPHHEALEAITVNPARIWGEQEFGEIAVGQDADIAVWSGDPFEPLTELTALYIRGEQQSLENRQTALRDKYMSAE